MLPSFNKALRRGLHTTMCCTCGCSRSYSQAAQVPSSQVTCSSPRRPWRNCRMLLALVSITDSITSFPLSFRTAITMASLCTSIPIVCGLPDYVEEVCEPSPDDLAEWRFEEPVHSLLNIVRKATYYRLCRARYSRY